MTREETLKELEEVSLRIKTDEFINPADVRREKELISLLLTGGESKEVRLQAGKMKKSKRVTPFNRTRS